MPVCSIVVQGLSWQFSVLAAVLDGTVLSNTDDSDDREREDSCDSLQPMTEPLGMWLAIDTCLKTTNPLEGGVPYLGQTAGVVVLLGNA